jgi:YD repeat-containing protein
MRLLAGLLLLALTVPAVAQDVRAPDGRLLYRYDQEGSRTVRRAPDGRMLDYSTTQSNGTTDFRAPDGRLLARQTPRH